MQNRFVVIMAGGFGERFWPASTKETPKQCLKIFTEKTMIEETVERLTQLIPEKNIFISTGKNLFEPIKKVVPRAKFVLEPIAKNTAACIGLSAIKILSENPEATILVETSDHTYKDNKKYFEHLEIGFKEAEKGKIVLIGITPTRPETGYGYIEKGNKIKDKLFEVKRFVEKPNKEKAEEFIESKNFLWNSGIFIFKAKVILESFKQFMPNLYQGLMKIKQSNFNEKIMQEVFNGLENISIDYGIMEKELNLSVVEAPIDWDDIGDWTALERKFGKDENQNTLIAPTIAIESKNNIVFGKKLIGLIGVKNLIIVESNDKILICHKNEAQNVKKIVKLIEKK